MEHLVDTLGITRLSKSRVSVMAWELDEAVEAFWTHPLDAGPYTFVAADALVLKVREADRGRGARADGDRSQCDRHREILGLHVSSADGAGRVGGPGCAQRPEDNVLSLTDAQRNGLGSVSFVVATRDEVDDAARPQVARRPLDSMHSAFLHCESHSTYVGYPTAASSSR